MQSRITHETRSSTIPDRPASPLLLICSSRFVPASSHIPSVSFPYCADTPSKFQPRRGRPCRRADDGVHLLHKPHDSNNQHHPRSPCPTTFPWFPLHTMRTTARNPNRGDDRVPRQSRRRSRTAEIRQSRPSHITSHHPRQPRIAQHPPVSAPHHANHRPKPQPRRHGRPQPRHDPDTTIQTPQSRHTGAKRAETAIRQRSPRGLPLRYLLRSATCHVSLLQ